MVHSTLTLTRRNWLGAVTAAVVGTSVDAGDKPKLRIDTHTHFYDPTRPEGVPWPGKQDSTLYRKVMPADYEKLAKPHGISGTVAIEASAWVEDNRWLLEVAEKNPIVVGVVGRLIPGDADFAINLKRFHKNPLYRGIRVTHEEIQLAANFPRFQAFADTGLTLDVNGGPEMLVDVAKLSDRLPKLRIVVNHMANVLIDGEEPPKVWLDGLKAIGKREFIWCKLSGWMDSSRKRGGRAPNTLDFYRPAVDAVWAAFGVEKLVFGSNWPVSDLYAPFATVHDLAAKYLAEKGQLAEDSVFGTNAYAAYQLKK